MPDGAVLRATLPGRPTADCLFADVGRDGRTALKARARTLSRAPFFSHATFSPHAPMSARPARAPPR
jgi:hypothetical protein